MKPFILMTLSVALFLGGCHEVREEAASPVSTAEVYKKIGEEIPYETGMAWIDLFKKQNSKLGRTESTDFNVPAAQLDAMLSSVEDLTGVAFHYGLDEEGITHILLIPVSSSLALWPADAQRTIIDANTGAAVSETTAATWTQQYKSVHSTDIWFHFFGKQVFDEMRAIPYLNSLDIQPAISSLDQTPQLLLIIWNEEEVSSGRTQNGPAVVYDASNACPPCAVY